MEDSMQKEEFIRGYRDAWLSSGSPPRIVVQETYVAAICGETYDEKVHKNVRDLLEFCRAALERNISLNWFKDHMPRAEKYDARRIAIGSGSDSAQPGNIRSHRRRNIFDAFNELFDEMKNIGIDPKPNGEDPHH